MNTDILIIGGGVIGSMIARTLCRYNLDVVIVEKESDLCSGTSKANSSMVHDGYNIDKNTLKGQLCLASTKEIYRELCDELHVEMNITGSLDTAFEEKDLAMIEHRIEMAEENGVKGMKRLTRDEVLALEPNISPDILCGLLNPNTGVINPFEFTNALAENAVLNGCTVLLNTEVLDIITKGEKIEAVLTSNGRLYPKIVINCAGLYSDKIASMVDKIDFEVKPRRGQYYLFDKQYGNHVSHCIYSAPTPVSKGLIIVPTTEGNLLCGSNAEVIDDKEDHATTKEALDLIYADLIHKILPKLPRVGDVTTVFSGNRSFSTNEDFIIAHSKSVPTMINLCGIQSPGLSSAPKIAEMVEGLVREAGPKLDWSKRADYIPGRPKPVRLAQMSYEEREAFVKENPDYGQIICRCETISKGEILDAIRRPVPAMTMDAIKRRTRAGMGRCQGGFCGPRVIEILAAELGVSPLDITKRGHASRILAMRAKELALQEGGNHEKIRL